MNSTVIFAAAKVVVRDHIQNVNGFASSSVLAVGCIVFAAIIIGTVVFQQPNKHVHRQFVHFPTLGPIYVDERPEDREWFDYTSLELGREDREGPNNPASGSWSQPLFVGDNEIYTDSDDGTDDDSDDSFSTVSLLDRVIRSAGLAYLPSPAQISTARNEEWADSSSVDLIESSLLPYEPPGFECADV